MFRVTRYPMISKTESGRVGYRKKYQVVGWVRVPAGHCPQDPPEPSSQPWRFSHNFTIVNLLLPKLLPTAHGWEQGAR